MFNGGGGGSGGANAGGSKSGASVLLEVAVVVLGVEMNLENWDWSKYISWKQMPCIQLGYIT